MVVDEVAGRRAIGHSGGFPGYITYTLLLVDDGIALSVLTNAVDGPAAQLALGVAKLLDGALGQPARVPLAAAEEPGVAGTSTTRFEGRFANVWGVVDIVRLGDRLLAIAPGAADPLDSVDELAVVDDATLRITKGDGFGSVDELVRYEFDAAGRVTSIRGFSGMTHWPFDLHGDPPFSAPWPA